MKRNKIFGVLLLSLTGCAVGPKYNPPEITLSDEWSLNDLYKTDFLQADVSVRWWEIFQEELLTKYIEKAASHNYTVLIAEQNIIQARALKTITASQLFPQLSADFDGSKTYFSKNGPIFAGPSLVQGVSGMTGLPFQIQIPQIQSLYDALIDMRWEVDIFGRIRKGVEARLAEVQKAADDKNNVLISVFAEIALNYMELRTAQQIGKLFEHNIRLLEESLSIEESRQKSGYSKTLDVLKSEADLAYARAELPFAYAKIYQSIYAISVLIGERPEALLPELLPISRLPELPDEIAIGIRSDLIRRRPDVNAAERSIAAATANVGIAVASFLPIFTLGGDIGYQSLKIANLFSGMSKTWSIGGDVNMPLFQGGRLIGNLRLSESQAVAAAQNYQQTVLSALQEVETALARYSSDATVVRELRTASQKDALALEIADQQYQQGYIDEVTRIGSQKKLNDARELEVEGQRLALRDLVVLYKALGGGYEPFEGKH